MKQPALKSRAPKSRQAALQFDAPPTTTDVEGAANILKVHPKTVLELIASGAIPAAKIGRAYAMMVKDVMDYLEQRIVAQTMDRMRSPTKGLPRGRNPAGSRTASSSGGSYGR